MQVEAFQSSPKSKSATQVISSFIGNILEHYDNALFGFLAPFLAPLFFDAQNPLTALILTYAILPMGLLTRPLGALFFGWFGDRFGTRSALFTSLVGMGLATLSLGFLPTYQEIGIYAPLLLTFGRMLQNFCAAGEAPGAAIFVLESTSKQKRSMMSSIIDASTMVGILLASALVSLLSAYGSIETAWRTLFWFGGSAAILGLILRLQNEDPVLSEAGDRTPKQALREIFKEHKGALFSIIIASGFSYTTYSIPFTLMNGFVPLVTALSKAEALHSNTLLLFIDMLLLPFFGYLSSRIGKEKVMFFATCLLTFCAVPLFMFLEGATLFVVIAIRLGVVIPGVAFAATYYAWALECVPKRHRFTILALGGALGSQLIGTPTSAVCLWLFQKTGWVFAPGIYLMGSSLLASGMLFYSRRAAADTAAESLAGSLTV